MPHDKLKPSFAFTAERLKELCHAVPEAMADGHVNWGALREAVGEWLEDEGEGAEHFGLTWPGKRDARRLAAMPSKGALVPSPGEGVSEGSTQNLFIEGDNLEVLKLLQKSYAGRVKMIYIDPPYNTGNDFVYEDDFTEPIEAYLRRTGQLGEHGEPLTTNTRANGRFHSKWLSMMYPRLLLARVMLRSDGVIFVSIDDTEVVHLRSMMDEIFGEENFVEQIVWKNKYGSGALTTGFANVHEYILCYSRSPLTNIEAPLDAAAIADYKLRDSKFAKRGGYVTQPLATTSKDDRPNLRYPIHYQGHEIWPEKQWIWAKERVDAAMKNDELVINETDGKFSVRVKQYLRNEDGVMRRGKPVSILLGPFNQDGTKELKQLLGPGVFDFPKPSALLKYLFSFVTNSADTRDGIYLDFFAGSGTSGHAIAELNREDGGNRKFILVQLPSETPTDSVARREGYANVADIGKERLRRLYKRLRKDAEPKQNEDLGFRVFALQRSQFSSWSDYDGDNLRKLTDLFARTEMPLTENWTPEGVLSEVMLLEGFPLNSKVERLHHLKRNHVARVTSVFCAHALTACFDDKLYSDSIDALDLGDTDVFVCLDAALTDQSKLRLADRCLLKTI